MKKAEKVLIAAVDYDTQFDFYSIPAVYVKNCRKMLKSIETDFDREDDFHAAQLFRYLMLILKGLFYEKLFFSDYRLAYSSVVIDKSSRMIFMKGIDSGDVEIDEDENEDTSSGEGVFFNINIPIDVLDKKRFLYSKRLSGGVCQYGCTNCKRLSYSDW